jgi:triosephosphate isomerase
MKHIPLVVGNWKMHPTTLDEATALANTCSKAAKAVTGVQVAVAPPALFVSGVAKILQKTTIALAAQDGFYQELGAFTGEVSMKQLAAAGVRYVIIGHSERRALGETDATVRQKLLAALKHKLIPIVCVGERERDPAGDFYQVVASQLHAVLIDLPVAQLKRVVIAYEPVWAIGTGKTATVDDVKEMQLYIHAFLTKQHSRAVAGGVQLLYGGSVKAHNAADLAREGGMHGFLVGGASLSATEFAAIVAAAVQDK